MRVGYNKKGFLVNRMYNVFNKRGRVGWIAAATEDAAKAYAMKRKSAKKIENLTVYDITESSLSIDKSNLAEVLNSGVEGFMGYVIPATTIYDMMNPDYKPKFEPHWEVHA